jgi:hypothetical protein
LAQRVLPDEGSPVNVIKGMVELISLTSQVSGVFAMTSENGAKTQIDVRISEY